MIEERLLSAASVSSKHFPQISLPKTFLYCFQRAPDEAYWKLPETFKQRGSKLSSFSLTYYVRLVWELVIQVLMRQQLFWGVTVSWEKLLIDSNSEENVCGTETNTKASHSTNMLKMCDFVLWLEHYLNPLSSAGPVWCMVWSNIWLAWFLSIFYAAEKGSLVNRSLLRFECLQASICLGWDFSGKRTYKIWNDIFF